jgi:integrase
MTKVPARLQNDPRYKAIYRAVKAAGAALGLNITVHDLRRLYVRLGVDARGEIATQHAVGHETPAMTAEYARWRSQAAVSHAVAQGLGLTRKDKRVRRKAR